MTGAVLSEWHAALSRDGRLPTSKPVDIGGFHHDVFLIESEGTYLTSGRESVRQVADYPIDVSDPNVTATVTIREGPVIEFDEDGDVIAR